MELTSFCGYLQVSFYFYVVIRETERKKIGRDSLTEMEIDSGMRI